MPHSTMGICRDPAGPEPSMVQGRNAGEKLIAAASACPWTEIITQPCKDCATDGECYYGPQKSRPSAL
jgi:hypothetical protein